MFNFRSEEIYFSPEIPSVFKRSNSPGRDGLTTEIPALRLSQKEWQVQSQQKLADSFLMTQRKVGVCVGWGGGGEVFVCLSILYEEFAAVCREKCWKAASIALG